MCEINNYKGIWDVNNMKLPLIFRRMITPRPKTQHLAAARSKMMRRWCGTAFLFTRWIETMPRLQVVM